MLLYLSIFACLFLLSTANSYEESEMTIADETLYVEEALVSEIMHALNSHTVDYVVLMYSSWCVHCHQLLMYLDIMAGNLNEQGKNIQFRKLNCELGKEHESK